MPIVYSPGGTAYIIVDSHIGMMLTGENRRTRRETCPSATLSTTNPTWTDPGLCSERPTTNRLSHGAATHCS
jgi:hypothetical protein